MIAIKLALITAKNLPGPIAIATDSLSSIKSIQSGHTKSNPIILNNIKAFASQLNTDLKIIWIPSHIGIPGNEADRLANLATQKDEIDIKSPIRMRPHQHNFNRNRQRNMGTKMDMFANYPTTSKSLLNYILTYQNQQIAENQDSSAD
jgi:ribonuclease HI